MTLSEEREWVLKGYLAMLVNMPPNGRYVHTAGQLSQIVKISLARKQDLSATAEKRIEELLVEVYGH